MNSRVIETAISTSNILAQIEAFLQATGHVHSTEEIISVEFPNSINLNKDGVIPIKIKFREEGVVLHKLNGA